MAGEVEEVGLRLTLKEQRQVAAGLKDTEQSLDQVGDAGERAGRKTRSGMRMMQAGLRGAGRGLGAVANLVKRGVLGVAATGVGLIGTALYKGFNRLQGIEDATASLTGLGNSAKNVRGIMTNALSAVRGTAFGMGEAATTAAGAVAAGVKPGKDLERTLKLVADAATIGKTSMGEMGSIFNKVATSNKLQADVMNQLSDRGIPIVQLLAKELGTTTDKVLEMSKEGKIGFDVFQRAMERGMGGAALESGNTTRGSLDNVGAALSRLGATALSRFYPLFRRVFKQATIVIDGLTERLGPLMKGFNSTLGPAMGKRIAGSGERILGWIDRQAKSVSKLVRAYKNAGGVQGVITTLQGKIPSGNATSLAGIATGFSDIGDSLKGVDWAQVKANLGSGATDTLSVFATVIGFAADHVDTLATYLPALVAGLVAYRVAQAAANIAALASIPLQTLQLVSQIRHTAALRANTAATTLNTGAEKKSLIGKVAHTTATVAQTVATKAAYVATKLLSLAMRMTPLGMVITAVALLTGGFILLYKKSETFRGIIDGLWNNVLVPFGKFLGGVLLGYVKTLAKGWLMMARFGVTAFRLLLTAAFKTFDGILSAAEAGLGWVKGLGDKIRGARTAFDQFGDNTIAKLKGVEDKLKSASDKVDQLGKKPPVYLDIYTRYTTLGAPGGSGPTRDGKDDFMGGGAGSENSGNTGGGKPAPRISLADPPAPTKNRPITFDPSRMPSGRVDVYLDGKKVAARVVRHVSAEGARR